MPSFRGSECWRPTPAHLRAIIAGTAACTIAVLAGRPDLLVVVAPLVTAALWGGQRRPSDSVTVEHALTEGVVYEGAVTTLTVVLSAGATDVDAVAAAIVAPDWIDVEPESGELTIDSTGGGSRSLTVAVQPARWGSYTLPPPLVVASTAWNGFRYATQRQPVPLSLTVLPRPDHFAAATSPVHAPGLVGLNPSPRPGDGLDLALVRPFQPGDRLRRIHWVESLRTGELHVTATFADHDRHVAIVVDAFEDLGASRGYGDRASSLDLTVRAAASIAEHYIRSGDRVGLSVIGARGLRQLRPASGRGHLRRILMTLAAVAPADAVRDDGRAIPGMTTDAVVLLLSPLTTAGARERVARLASGGMRTIAIDCLPPDIADNADDPYTALAWRIEYLERARHLRAIRSAGTPVVPWRGTGSLDHVLQPRRARR